MINYLQSVAILGVATRFQRDIAKRHKQELIESGDNSSFEVGSVRALQRLAGSVAMNEDRLEERKHGLRTPQQDEDFLLDIHDHYLANSPQAATRVTGGRLAPHLGIGAVDIVA